MKKSLAVLSILAAAAAGCAHPELRSPQPTTTKLSWATFRSGDSMYIFASRATGAIITVKAFEGDAGDLEKISIVAPFSNVFCPMTYVSLGPPVFIESRQTESSPSASAYFSMSDGTAGIVTVSGYGKVGTYVVTCGRWKQADDAIMRQETDSVSGMARVVDN